MNEYILNETMRVSEYSSEKHKHSAFACFNADFSMLYQTHPKLTAYKHCSDQFLLDLEEGTLDSEQHLLVLEQRHTVMATLCYAVYENGDCNILHCSLLPIFSEKKRQACLTVLLDALQKRGEFSVMHFDLFEECHLEIRSLLTYGFKIVERIALFNDKPMPWLRMEIKL